MSSIWSRKTNCRVLAAIFSVITVLLAVLCIMEDGFRMPVSLVGIVLGLGAVIVSMLKRPSGKWGTVFSILAAILIPAAGALMLQQFTLDPLLIYPQMMLVNFAFAWFFYLLLSFLAGNFCIGYAAGSAVLMLIGIANYFVVEFRSSPIVPWDLYSISTAMSVAGNYTWSVDWRFCLSVTAFLLMIALSVKMTFRIRAIPARVLGTILSAGLLVGSGFLLQRDDVKEMLSMDTILFTPNVRYRNNGFLAAYIGDLHLIRVEEPDGYSVKKVSQIAETYASGTGTAAGTAAGNGMGMSAATAVSPNIIIIMNEAFSDLSILGNFAVSEDYMPCMRSLMKEYAGGNLLVSVKGGNTANTEYEFLAGDTMAFLPEGSVVYQQFIHDNVPALPSYLAGLGYTTTAIHPYLPGGWDRDKVYDMLGFRTFLSRNDFSSPQLMRGYVSDASAFQKIIDVFEQREDDRPQFVFEVTMQNHGGYSKDAEGFSEEIFLEDKPKKTTRTRAVEKYLTLIRKSDDALADLVRYFEAYDEPTVIVMFGDHQPSDYITELVADLTGYDPDVSLEEAQKSYMVPYVVWNNFGMKFPNLPLVSVNYLAADLLQAASMPLTEYQSFLLAMQKELPAVANGAWVDDSGNYHGYDEKGNEKQEELLSDYRIMEYNHLIDRKDRVTEVFAAPQ